MNTHATRNTLKSLALCAVSTALIMCPLTLHAQDPNGVYSLDQLGMDTDSTGLYYLNDAGAKVYIAGINLTGNPEDCAFFFTRASSGNGSSYNGPLPGYFSSGERVHQRVTGIAINGAGEFLPVSYTTEIYDAIHRYQGERGLGVYPSSMNLDLPAWDGYLLSSSGELYEKPHGDYRVDIMAYSDVCGSRRIKTDKLVTYEPTIYTANGVIGNVHASKTMEVALPPGLYTGGGNVQQWFFRSSGASAVYWNVKSVGYELNRVTFKLSGALDECLEVENWYAHDGANVRMAPCDGGANQQWDVVHAVGNHYELRNAHSGKCLEVENWYRHDGANIQQSTCGNSIWSGNQQWQTSSTLL